MDNGIACPSCGGRESRVTDTRKEKNRRRECNGCGFRFNTEERIVNTRQTPVFEKIPGVCGLLELFKSKTVSKLAAQFNVSKQRVHQLLSKNPEDFERIKQEKEARFVGAIKVAHAEGKTTSEIAENEGVNSTWQTVTRRLTILGLTPNYKERELLAPGCPKCETEPYALGFCKNCHERNRRQAAKST